MTPIGINLSNESAWEAVPPHRPRATAMVALVLIGLMPIGFHLFRPLLL